MPVHVLIATGVNADGQREIFGVQVASSEDGAGWLGFFRDLTARDLSGVKLRAQAVDTAPDTEEVPELQAITA